MTTTSDTSINSGNVARVETGVAPSGYPFVAAPRVAKAHRRGWIVRRVLVLADVVGLLGAFLLSEFAVSSSGGLNALGWKEEWLLFLLVLPLWVMVGYLYGLYSHDDERTDHTTVDDFGGVFHLVTIGTCVTFFAGSLSGMIDPSRNKMAVFWLAAVAFVSLTRSIGRAACRSSASYLQNTLVIGNGVTDLIASKVQRHPEYGLKLVGVVDERPRAEGAADIPFFSTLAAVPLLVRTLAVERVIIALPSSERERVLHLIRELRELNTQIDVVPYYYEALSSSMDIHSIEGLPLLGLRPAHLEKSSIVLKRAMDITLSGLGIIAIAPLFCLIAVAIKLDSRGPVLFRQLRMGHKGETFKIFKFRSMQLGADARREELRHLSKYASDDGDPYLLKIADDPRVTRVGGFLRRHSLDELPQLLNVFAGKMSMVGPRPLPLDEDSFVTEWARHRLDLKPGITGPWQVLGRHEIPFDEMVELDYRYVTSWSLVNDLKLTLKTIPVLMRSSAV
ncbi:MAG: sugar transferase [Gaiellaceae bacterium]